MINIKNILTHFQDHFPPKYREGNLIFAYHAAFPIFLTSKLLYQIWLNFKHYQNEKGEARLIPYTAISDFIHSELCEQVGFDLYEVPRDIRKGLLEKLAADKRFCNAFQNRQEELANFTYQYANTYYSQPKRQNMKDVLQWTALVALDRNYAAQKMQEFLENKEQKYSNKSLLRLHMLINELQEQDEAFGELIEYSAVLTTKPEEGDTTLLRVPAGIRSKMSEKVIEEMQQRIVEEQQKEEAFSKKVEVIRADIVLLKETFERMDELNIRADYVDYFVEGIVLDIYDFQANFYEDTLNNAKSEAELEYIEQLVQYLDRDRKNRGFYVNRLIRVLNPLWKLQQRNIMSLFLENMFLYLGALKFAVETFDYEPDKERIPKKFEVIERYVQRFAKNEKKFLEWQVNVGRKTYDYLDDFDTSQIGDDAEHERFDLAILEYQNQLNYKQSQLVKFIVQERIEGSLESKTLDISNLGLTELPEVVCEQTHLETLILGRKGDDNPNRIVKIPRQIGRLSNVKQLVYSANFLEEVPSFITFLSGLEELDVSYNQLKEIPRLIFEMPNFKNLKFGENPCTEPPVILDGEDLIVLRKYVNRELLEEQYVGLQTLNNAWEDLQNEQFDACLNQIKRVNGDFGKTVDTITLENTLIQLKQRQFEAQNRKISKISVQATLENDDLRDYVEMVKGQLEEKINVLKQSVLDLMELEMEQAQETEEVSKGYQGKAYFFGIGIDQYKGFPALTYAVRNVRQLSNVLAESYQFDRANFTILSNEEATTDRIFLMLRELTWQLTEWDSLLIFFSGQGGYDKEIEEGYWIPFNGVLGKNQTYINVSRVLDYLKEIPAQHIFIISDSKFSDGFRENEKIQTGPDKSSRYMLSSGRTDVVADGKQDNSFSENLINLLENNINPTLSLNELGERMQKAIRKNSFSVPTLMPLNNIGHEGGMFYLKRKDKELKIDEAIEQQKAEDIENEIFKPLKIYIHEGKVELAMNWLQGYVEEMKDEYVLYLLNNLFEELEEQKSKLSKKRLVENELPLNFIPRIESLLLEVEKGNSFTEKKLWLNILKDIFEKIKGREYSLATSKLRKLNNVFKADNVLSFLGAFEDSNQGDQIKSIEKVKKSTLKKTPKTKEKEYNEEIEGVLLNLLQAIRNKVFSFKREKNTGKGGRLFVVFVAIDEYPVVIGRLFGSKNSVHAFKAVIERIVVDRFAEVNFKLLFDAEGTRENIISSFQFFKEAKDGDTCIFYYSGHSIHIDSPPGLLHFADEDNNISTLLPIDGKLEGGGPILNVELSYLIWKTTRNKNLHFLVVLDSCHSENMTNSYKKEENLETNENSPDVQDQKRQKENIYRLQNYMKDFNAENTHRIGKHILLAGTQNDQESKEIEYDNKSIGVFTFSLVQIINWIGPSNSFTYEELNILVEWYINKLEPRQNSKFNYAHQELKDLPFLG